MPDVLIKTKLDAIVAPTATDDSAAGYSVFSPWVDITADQVYFAVDVSVGAAIWRKIMPASVYDPESIALDIFDLDNHFWGNPAVANSIRARNVSGVLEFERFNGATWDNIGNIG